MTSKLLQMVALFAMVSVTACTCNRVTPNYEGVLMTGYGRNGKADFQAVTGAQGILWPGSELYQVPMFEQKADPPEVVITARDAGVFSVDPSLTYQAIRGKGVDIIFHYKHVGIDDVNMIMDNIEESVLNALVVNSYREEARNFTTDSLMNNLNSFEEAVEVRLKREFETKFFTLTALTSGLKPPKSMSEAIERRNNAKQEAEQVKNELEVARMNLEKSKIEAEANRVKASGLEPRVLQEQWIEAIRNTQNKVIITDGKTPVILGGQ
ncbi:MAG: SPFH domain-containing protein [Candidatus Pseudobacter hemicellulosilyticus]|uniref:SPFH domain-containing protein n=1 Tax=Candidatus Pseudobacter hemicellulosilyticus TaxID=3121375 RepID=A0AAJ5WMV4_9BACT|nr:MAG: SPFH domain-containing protein [Pseudobacter sp.]